MKKIRLHIRHLSSQLVLLSIYGVLLACAFTALPACHPSEINQPSPKNDYTIALASFQANEGTVSGFAQGELHDPIWSQPGLLLVVYDYNTEGRRAAMALVSLSGKPSFSDGSVGVTQLCRAPHVTLKAGLPVSRLVEFPVELSPCLTQVTGYENGHVVLDLDLSQVHIGDEYGIMLSATASDLINQKNIALCNISSERHPKTAQTLCKLQSPHLETLTWASVIHRVAVLTHPAQESKVVAKEDLASGPSIEKEESGPYIEKKYRTILTNGGLSYYQLAGFDKQNPPPWVKKGRFVIVHLLTPSSESSDTSQLTPIGLAQVLDPSSPDGQSVSGPCLSHGHVAGSLGKLPVSPAMGGSVLGRCAPSVVSSKVQRNKRKMESIILQQPNNLSQTIQVGDIYELHAIEEHYISPQETGRCQIVADGFSTTRARCVFITPVPKGPINRYVPILQFGP